MFYADFVLSKKGPLARIWLAAHWDRKLTKSQVFETNIEKSVDGILQPSVKMALRTSGHLLLGVVRIYSRKAKYLLADCNEAFVKIKMAFRPGMVDLPEDHREAAVSAVTLPEVFHDFDSAIPELKYVWNDVDIEMQFSVHQSRADEITMREDFANITHGVNEEHFGDPSFNTADSSDVLRNSAPSFDQSLNQTNLLFNDGNLMPNKDSARITSNKSPTNDDVHMTDNDFSEDISVPAGGLFEGGLFDDTPMPDVPMVENDSFCIGNEHNEQMEIEHAVNSVSKLSPQTELDLQGRHFNSPSLALVINENNVDDEDDDHFIPPSPTGGSSDGSRPPSPVLNKDENKTVNGEKQLSPVRIAEEPQLWSPVSRNVNQEEEVVNEEQINAKEEAEKNEEDVNENIDQTTLINNDEGTFALLPVDTSIVKGMAKSKRKRKLIVDEIKNISGEEMKAQLSDTSDIITTLDLAPPTKRLMHWKETGGVEKLFALPGRSIPSRILFKNYQRHLTSRLIPNEDIAENGEQMEVENVKENIPPADAVSDTKVHYEAEQIITTTTGRRGRKRKHQPEEEVRHIDDVLDDKRTTQEESPAAKRILQDNNLSVVAENYQNGTTEEHRLSPVQPIKFDENIHVDNLPEKNLIPEIENIEINKPTEEIISFNESVAPTIDMPVDIPDDMPVDIPGDMPVDIPVDVPLQAPAVEEVNTDSVPILETSNEIQHFAQQEDNLNNNFEKDAGELIIAESNADPISENIALNNDVEPLLSGNISPGPENLQPYSNEDIDNLKYDLNSQIIEEAENVYCDDGMNYNNAQLAGGSTPWHDDYECPLSVSQCTEQAENETIEEFEERILNKRAAHLYNSIRAVVSTESQTVFSKLVKRNSRKQVAQKFYSLLVLKKFKVLELEQDEPYGEIILTKSINFDDPKL